MTNTDILDIRMFNKNVGGNSLHFVFGYENEGVGRSLCWCSEGWHSTSYIGWVYHTATEDCFYEKTGFALDIFIRWLITFKTVWFVFSLDVLKGLYHDAVLVHFLVSILNLCTTIKYRLCCEANSAFLLTNLNIKPGFLP